MSSASQRSNPRKVPSKAPPAPSICPTFFVGDYILQSFGRTHCHAPTASDPHLGSLLILMNFFRAFSPSLLSIVKYSELPTSRSSCLGRRGERWQRKTEM